jgi:hypothetical protein
LKVNKTKNYKMSDTKPTLTERIKAAFLDLGITIPAKKVETPVVKLEDVTLKDGTMLNVDSIEVGANATFTGADGIPVPAEGTYEAEDGTMMVCVGGVITEIKPKEVENPAPTEDMATVLSKLSELSERVKAFDGKFKKQEDEKKSLEVKLEATQKGIAKAFELMEEVSSQAAGVSLELQSTSKKVKKAIDKPYDKMNNHEKMLFNKGKL